MEQPEQVLKVPKIILIDEKSDQYAGHGSSTPFIDWTSPLDNKIIGQELDQAISQWETSGILRK